jgi:hypothetical protein
MRIKNGTEKKASVPQENAEKSRPVEKIVFVQDFIEEGGKTIGVKGLSYPDKTEICVTLTTDGAHAENVKRPTFDAYHKGTGIVRNQKISEGAVLRLNCHDRGGNNFQADWINVVAHNLEEQKSTLTFGYIAAEAYSSKEIFTEQMKIRERLSKEQPELSGSRLSRAVEKELRGRLEGEQRFNNAYVFVYHNKDIVDVTAEQAQDYFMKYYSEARFAPVYKEGEEKPLERVAPGLMIRAVNSEGEVIDCAKIGASTLYKDNAHTPEERAGVAMKYMRDITSPDVVGFSVLPFDRVRIGAMTTEVSVKNTIVIDHFQRLMSATRLNRKDEEGNRYVEEFAVQGVAKFSQPSGLASDALIPYGSKRVDVALLDRDGGELAKANTVAPTDSADEDDSPSPGM